MGELPDDSIFVLLLVLFAGIFIVPPIGVLLRKPWGFYLGIVVNGVLILSFPFGTVFGIITMKAFLNSKDAFGVR